MTDPADLRAALAAGRSPGELGFVMPAETAPHACCWMAWVHDDHPENWGTRDFSAVERAFVAVARAIAAFEPVRVVADPHAAARARKLLPDHIDIVTLPQDDLWFRDTGPLFVQNPAGQTLATNLHFTNWGEKYPGSHADRAVGAALARSLDLPLFQSPLVGEGGALISDGAGTVITTETCMLNPNRNPGMTKADVERGLFDAIGARKVIWLPGDADEWITDGHIDGVLTYVRPGHVLFEDNPDPDHPHHKVVQENLRAMRGQTDAQGREIEITLLDEAHTYRDESAWTATSYVNCYIANGGVVLPRFGTETDAPAVAAFARAFPDRRIVQVDVRDICWNGGGIHCMTQQQPA